MTEYLSLLGTVRLFSGIESSDLYSMLNCVDAKTRTVRKGEIVLLAGDTPKHVGITLSGQLHIIREDYDGNRSLISVLEPGDIFAEALCCAGVTESPVSVVAYLDSNVLTMSFERVLGTCPNSCPFHKKLITNMLGLIARKNLMMQSHMEILSLKSVRARLLRYIESFVHEPFVRDTTAHSGIVNDVYTQASITSKRSARNKGVTITIPLNREELANYLCVDRSALSHELMKMKKDGLIEYRKNEFTLLKH